MSTKTPLVAVLAILMLAAPTMGAAESMTFHTTEAEILNGASLQGDLTLVELKSLIDGVAIWSAGGSQASLHIQGEDKHEVAETVGGPSDPVDETYTFTDWTMSGGDWKENSYVLIGLTSEQTAQIDLNADSLTAHAAGSEALREQEGRFSAPVEAVTFDPAGTIAWSSDALTTIRVEGDFTVTAWSADMVIGDADTGTQTYHTGTERIPQEGAEDADDTVYVAKSRINNLYVQDGWLELTILSDKVQTLGSDDFVQNVFLHNTVVDLAGNVLAPQARLLEGGTAIAENTLSATGPVGFMLTPTTDGSSLAMGGMTPSTTWEFGGVPLFDQRGNLLDSEQIASRLGTTLIDPTEGWSIWAQAVAWTVFGVVMLVALELTGVAPLGRAKFNLATYRYDAVRARSYWKWFPAALRTRMYFNAALAAAGREDHQAALDYASSVPKRSRWSNPARFVAVQSMAALGHDTAAELALMELAASDHRYQALAKENPFLRHLA